MLRPQISDPFGIPDARCDAGRDGWGPFPTTLREARNGRSALYIVLLLTLSWSLAYAITAQDTGPQTETLAPDGPGPDRPDGVGGS